MKITIFLCLLAMSAGIASGQRLARYDLTIGETMSVNIGDEGN